MAKAVKKTTPAASNHLRTAKAVAAAIAKARKAAGKRGDDADIHVHVGDVVMMGFDEAVDAEEWGARETTHELAGGKGRRGGRAADPQDEKNRKVHRTITLRKGPLKLQAVERSQPVRKKKAAKKAVAKAAKKPGKKAGGKAPGKRAKR